MVKKGGIMEKLICDVCKNEEAVGVASSMLGPISLAYGQNCLEQGREPYWLLVNTAVCVNGYHNGSEWFKELVVRCLDIEGKSIEDFEVDVTEGIEGMHSRFDKQKEEDGKLD